MLFDKLFQGLKTLTLPFFVLIGIVLLAVCALLFPDRLPGLLAFINRQFFAALFVFVLFWISDLDEETKPIVLGCALIGAGMAI